VVIDFRWGEVSMTVQTRVAGRPAFVTVFTLPFPVLERTGRVSDHSLPSSAEVAKGLKLYLRHPSMPASACHGVTFTF
jgi:hypothetical protein